MPKAKSAADTAAQIIFDSRAKRAHIEKVREDRRKRFASIGRDMGAMLDARKGIEIVNVIDPMENARKAFWAMQENDTDRNAWHNACAAIGMQYLAQYAPDTIETISQIAERYAKRFPGIDYAQAGAVAVDKACAFIGSGIGAPTVNPYPASIALCMVSENVVQDKAHGETHTKVYAQFAMRRLAWQYARTYARKASTGRGSMPRVDDIERQEGSPNYAFMLGENVQREFATNRGGTKAHPVADGAIANPEIVTMRGGVIDRALQIASGIEIDALHETFAQLRTTQKVQKVDGVPIAHTVRVIAPWQSIAQTIDYAGNGANLQRRLRKLIKRAQGITYIDTRHAWTHAPSEIAQSAKRIEKVQGPRIDETKRFHTGTIDNAAHRAQCAQCRVAYIEKVKRMR